MPSFSLNCFALLAAVLLLGGVSPAAGQNNVFANRAALLVARDAWCADPTAAAAIYGPIRLWDISQVTDLSYVFCADSWCTSHGGNPACRSFNSDISGWDTSNVTTLLVRSTSPPLHPPTLTRTRCLAFAYHSLCRVQYTFNDAIAFNQPLEAWDVSRVQNFGVRAASPPLSRITATASHRHGLLTLSLFLSDSLLASHLSHALLFPTV